MRQNILDLYRQSQLQIPLVGKLTVDVFSYEASRGNRLTRIIRSLGPNISLEITPISIMPVGSINFGCMQ